MSDTPQTDAIISSDTGDSGFIHDLAQLARKLERELCAIREDAQRLGDAIMALRHAKGRHNTGVAYERLLAEYADFQLKHTIR